MAGLDALSGIIPVPAATPDSAANAGNPQANGTSGGLPFEELLNSGISTQQASQPAAGANGTPAPRTNNAAAPQGAVPGVSQGPGANGAVQGPRHGGPTPSQTVAPQSPVAQTSATAGSVPGDDDAQSADSAVDVSLVESGGDDTASALAADNTALLAALAPPSLLASNLAASAPQPRPTGSAIHKEGSGAGQETPATAQPVRTVADRTVAEIPPLPAAALQTTANPPVRPAVPPTSPILQSVAETDTEPVTTVTEAADVVTSPAVPPQEPPPTGSATSRGGATSRSPQGPAVPSAGPVVRATPSAPASGNVPAASPPPHAVHERGKIRPPAHAVAQHLPAGPETPAVGQPVAATGSSDSDSTAEPVLELVVDDQAAPVAQEQQPAPSATHSSRHTTETPPAPHNRFDGGAAPLNQPVQRNVSPGPHSQSQPLVSGASQITAAARTGPATQDDVDAAANEPQVDFQIQVTRSGAGSAVDKPQPGPAESRPARATTEPRPVTPPEPSAAAEPAVRTPVVQVADDSPRETRPILPARLIAQETRANRASEPDTAPLANSSSADDQPIDAAPVEPVRPVVRKAEPPVASSTSWARAVSNASLSLFRKSAPAAPAAPVETTAGNGAPLVVSAQDTQVLTGDSQVTTTVTAAAAASTIGAPATVDVAAGLARREKHVDRDPGREARKVASRADDAVVPAPVSWVALNTPLRGTQDTAGVGGMRRLRLPAEQSDATLAALGVGSQPHVSSVAADPAAAPDPLHHSPFAQQLQSAISAAATPPGETVRIELAPPELGRLQVDIQHHAGQYHARLEIETKATHQLVLETLPQLRESLSDRGLQFDRIDVVLNDAGSGQFGGQSFGQGTPQQPVAAEDWLQTGHRPVARAAENMAEPVIPAPHFLHRSSARKQMQELDIRI